MAPAHAISPTHHYGHYRLTGHLPHRLNAPRALLAPRGSVVLKFLNTRSSLRREDAQFSAGELPTTHGSTGAAYVPVLAS